MVNIDNPDIIEEVMSYHPKEIEPLYWKIEDSITSGKNNLAKSIYSSFLCLAKYNKKILTENLNPCQLARLRQLTFELFGETSFKEIKTISIKESTGSKTIPFSKESELRDFLVDNKYILEKAYDTKIRYIDKEVKTNFGYQCDIVAEDDRFCYPTELKIAQAKHGVISQIEKYCHFFYRQYRYNFYKKMQGVVIANGFDAFSINELRRNNILCFEVNGTLENLFLKSID